jgi:hypothetical protein
MLAEPVGPKGRVAAIEFEPDLEARAAANLGPWPWVHAIDSDGSAVAFDAADVIYLNDGAARPAIEIGILAHVLEDTHPNPAVRPAPRSPPHSVPIAEFGRQVAPWRARSRAPQRAFHKPAICSLRDGPDRPASSE